MCLLALAFMAATDTVIGRRLRSAGMRLISHPKLAFLGPDIRGAVETRLRWLLGESDTKRVIADKNYHNSLRRHPLNRKSTFETLGVAALKEVVADYGGDDSQVVENASMVCFDEASVKRELHFDAMYTGPLVSVAVDFLGISDSIYPNPFHLTREEFNARASRLESKVVDALRSGVMLVPVPYTVDRCERDSREESGWRFVPELSNSERKDRIASYIKMELTRRLNSSANLN